MYRKAGSAFTYMSMLACVCECVHASVALIQSVRCAVYVVLGSPTRTHISLRARVTRAPPNAIM